MTQGDPKVYGTTIRDIWPSKPPVPVDSAWRQHYTLEVDGPVSEEELADLEWMFRRDVPPSVETSCGRISVLCGIGAGTISARLDAILSDSEFDTLGLKIGSCVTITREPSW